MRSMLMLCGALVFGGGAAIAADAPPPADVAARLTPDDFCRWWASAPNASGQRLFVCIRSNGYVLMSLPPGTLDAQTQGRADAGDPRAMLLIANDRLFHGDMSAIALVQKAAAANELDAMAELGAMYGSQGLLPPDPAKALSIYRAAADRGGRVAMANLGQVYAVGDGAPKDDVEATRWFRMAAEHGDLGSMLALGIRTRSGTGTAKDGAQAVTWLTRAYEGGLHGQPALYLAQIYDTGDGVPPDPAQAAQWYTRAAENGLAPAATALAAMYRDGRGVPRDADKAAHWDAEATRLNQRNAPPAVAK